MAATFYPEIKDLSRTFPGLFKDYQGGSPRLSSLAAKRGRLTGAEGPELKEFH